MDIVILGKVMFGVALLGALLMAPLHVWLLQNRKQGIYVLILFAIGASGIFMALYG